MVYSQILPTTSNSKDHGVFTCYGVVEISASAEEVWSAVTDFAAYPDWNQYTPSLETPPGSNAIAVGDMCTLKYRPTISTPAAPIPIRIMDISHDDMFVCWRGCPKGIPSAVLCPEKYQKVTATGENSCKFEVWETQAGMLAHVVKWTMGSKLDGMNQGIADNLKAYVESKKSADQAART